MRDTKQLKTSSEAAGPSNSGEDAPDVDASRVWLPEIVERIASFMPNNEVACTLRLVCCATAQQCAGRAVVRPAQPVPRWCFAAECRRVCRGLTLAKRRKLVCLTAASGDVPNLGIAVAEAGCPLTVRALEAAAGAGQLSMCQWLVGPGGLAWDRSTASRACEAAAAGGHGHVVDWCLAPHGGAVQPEDCLEGAVNAALRNGHEVLAWRLVEAHTPGPGFTWDCWGEDMLAAAAEGSSLASLQWVWEQYSRTGVAPQKACGAIGDAIASSTPDWQDKVQYLIDQGQSVPADAHYDVAWSMSGSAAVERMVWLKARGVAPTAGALRTAAGRGDAVLVAYLLGQGLKPRRYDCVFAAEAGCLEALQALLAAAEAAGQELDLTSIALGAASSGSLPSLSWLVETYGAEAIGGLTPDLFRRVASRGHVQLMAWLLERGCGVDGGAWAEAAGSGSEAALELLSKRDCPRPSKKVANPYWEAFRMCGFRTLAVLRRLGIPFGPDGGQALCTRFVREVCEAATARKYLEWLHANGCCVDWAGAERAAGRRAWGAEDKEAFLAWLAERRAAEPPPPPRREGLRPRRGK